MPYPRAHRRRHPTPSPSIRAHSRHAVSPLPLAKPVCTAHAAVSPPTGASRSASRVSLATALAHRPEPGGRGRRSGPRESTVLISWRRRRCARRRSPQPSGDTPPTQGTRESLWKESCHASGGDGRPIRVHLWFPSRLEPQMNTDEHGSSSGGNTKAQGAGRGTVRLAVARQHPTAMLPVRSSVHGGAWLPCPPSPPVSPVVHLSFQAPRELGGGNHDAHRSGFTRRVKSPGPTAIPNIPRNQQLRHEWDRVSRRSWSYPDRRRPRSRSRRESLSASGCPAARCRSYFFRRP